MSAPHGLPGPDDWAPPADAGHRWAGRRATLVAVVVFLLAVAANALLWPGSDDAAPSEADPPPAVPVTRGKTTPPPRTASASSSPLPGALTVSTHSIDLGRTATRASFNLVNTGELPVIYQLSSRTRWLSVGSIGGELGGGSVTQVVVGADRSHLPEGTSTGRVLVTWDGGSATVTLSLDEERPPVVGAPRAGARTCTTSGRVVTVTAFVSDDSRLSSVRLTWTGPSGSGRATMTRAGSVWAARMGPFAVGGAVTVGVTATDRHGNTTTGPATTTGVDPCPP